MKHLAEYIKESIDENKWTDRWLIKTEEDAKEYLKYKFKPSKNAKETCLQNELGISDNEIEKLYDFVHEYNLPAPFVGSYRAKNGKINFSIAFRRWFNPEKQKELTKWNDNNPDRKYDLSDVEFTFNSDSKYFADYHDTLLKENGIFIPNAQDWEELISLAYNKNFSKEYKDKTLEDISKLVGINNNKIVNMIKFYNTNRKTINNIAAVLFNQCKNISGFEKLKNKKNQVSKEWYDKGMYKDIEPNNTPKTDIISKDAQIRLSLKKEGGSQLMSAKLPESRATLLFGTEYIKDDDEKSEVVTLLTNLLTVNKPTRNADDEEIQVFDDFGPEDLNGHTVTQMCKEDPEFNKRYEASKKKGKDFEKQLNELVLNKYPDYKEGLYIEAMTGNHKFIKNSPSIANYIFVWDDIKPSNSKLYNPHEYYEHIKNNSVVTVDFKSWPTSNRSGQTLKIITK